MLSEQSLRSRARMASAAARVARRPEDPEALAAAQDARRDYFAVALEDYIKRTVDAAPPLTEEQRARIAALLTTGGQNAAA